MKKLFIGGSIMLLIILLSNCQNKKTQEPITNLEPIDYLKQGKNIATATGTVLMNNLLTAINEDDTAGALRFCNAKAIALTDSMGTTLQAKVRRVSDKNRNPKNEANELELAYIDLAKSQINSNGGAKPQLLEDGDKMLAYYPIMINGMCLQCHGSKNTDIAEKTLKEINIRYPNDKATGYVSGDLRGIWVITMNKAIK